MLYEVADVMRARVIALCFGLIFGLIVMGLVALMWLTLTDHPTDQIFEYLKLFAIPLLAIASIAGTYLFVSSRAKGGGKLDN